MKSLKKILVVPDSFKESISSIKACAIIKQGLEEELQDAQITTLPLADGGEGSLEAIENSISSKRIYLKAKNALGNEIETFYLKSSDEVAFIEMAKINGLEQIPISDRNPLFSSTFGTGELVKHAIENKAKKIIVFIGGSATNDGGVGMAQALGIQFKNAKNEEIPLGGKYLNEINTVDFSNSILQKNTIEILVACDVKNQLLGENGATYSFSKQKGATPEMQTVLEKGLENLVEKLGNTNHLENGSGAAGGLGYGLMSFANATIEKGFEVIAKAIHLENHIQNTDIVITGEGSFDWQSLQGKVPYALGKMCLKHQKPLLVLAGNVGVLDHLEKFGITVVFPIIQGITSLENALKNGNENLYKTSKNIAKLLKLNTH